MKLWGFKWFETWWVMVTQVALYTIILLNAISMAMTPSARGWAIVTTVFCAWFGGMVMANTAYNVGRARGRLAMLDEVINIQKNALAFQVIVSDKQQKEARPN
jgi:hypothetical protein